MPKRGLNIYKRKDGRWEARYVKGIGADGKKKYGSVYSYSYSDAKEKQKHCIANTKRTGKIGYNNTLSDLADEWLSNIKNSVKILTYQKYESIINNHIKTYFRGFSPDLITGQIVSEFSDNKISYLSKSTVNEILTVIGLIFSYGEKEYGIIRPNFKSIKTPLQEMRVLSIFEQKTLENYLLHETDIYKFGIILLLYTGLRIGELCALQWEDIKDGYINVNKTMHRIKSGSKTEIIIESPKTAYSNRQIPTPDFLFELINGFREKGSVLKTNSGKPVEPRVMQLRFSSYLKSCGIKNATPHCLRHTFATRCVEAGFDIKSLSEILGHSSVKITLDRYVHSSFEQKQKNMKLLTPVVNF